MKSVRNGRELRVKMVDRSPAGAGVCSLLEEKAARVQRELAELKSLYSSYSKRLSELRSRLKEANELEQAIAVATELKKIGLENERRRG